MVDGVFVQQASINFVDCVQGIIGPVETFTPNFLFMCGENKSDE